MRDEAVMASNRELNLDKRRYKATKYGDTNQQRTVGQICQKVWKYAANVDLSQPTSMGC